MKKALKRFKASWEITRNWQLIFPVVGLVCLGYLAFKFSFKFLGEQQWWLTLIGAVVLFLVTLKFTLFLFKKLENRWHLTYRWEMIRVFIVFAITGSSSLFVGRPIIKWIGITKENLNPFLYWVLFIIIGLIFYQILLVFYGWLFGQFKFFWEFEKKMLKRFGIKNL